MARGAVLRNLINTHNPTLIFLIETKRKRKDIPGLPNYNFFSLDPLDGSSGGIALYLRQSLCFRTSIAFSSVSNSIIWIHLRHHVSSSKDLYICGVYAPTATSSNTKKVSFWEELNSTTSDFQDQPGHCILAGDFNARIGDLSGDHATNSNMGPFMEFLDNHPPLTNINVLRTYGQYTFINISNGSRSIIDYLLTDLPVSKVSEHKVLHGNLGTSCQTAHKALLTKFLLKVKEEHYQHPNQKPKWRKISNQNRQRYYTALTSELSFLLEDSVSYTILISAINRSKTNALGRMRPRPPNSSSMTPEIDRLDAELGAALETHRLNPSAVYLRKVQTLEKTLREKRNEFETNSLLELLERLEGLHQVQKMRLFYKIVKERTQPQTNPTYVICNPSSSRNSFTYSTTKEEYLNFWGMYLENKFSSPSLENAKSQMSFPPTSSLMYPMPTPSQSSMDRPLTMNEVSMAIKKLKNMKAAGMDEITNEDIKLIEKFRPNLIYAALQRLWRNETCPSQFRESLFHLIPKPGKPGKPKDLRLQKNYRPIALLSAFRKLYEAILSTRILNNVQLNKSQFGFLSGQSTSDCIFLLVEAIIEARYSVRGPRNGKNQKLFAAFLDIKGAFDDVPRERIWQKLYWRFGISGKLLRVIVDLYSDTTGYAIVNGLSTRTFPINSGVLQGSVLGPTLFLLFLDDLLEELHKSELGILMGEFILSVLAFADDVTVLSLSDTNLQHLLNICSAWASTNRKTFGLDKCFAVVLNSRTKNSATLPTFLLGVKPDSHQLTTFYPENAPDLYLGFNITDRIARTKLDSSEKLPHSLVPIYRLKPNSVYLKLIKSRFMRARHGTSQLCTNKAILTPSISTRLYKTLQRSTLLYLIEFGDWDIDQIRVLETLQAKALRTCLNSDLQCPQAILRLFSGVEPIMARRDLHTLLYFTKLCSRERTSFPAMVHRARVAKADMPVGFHCSVRRVLTKYGLKDYWNHIPDVTFDKLSSHFKRTIWTYHWKQDVTSTISRDSPFSYTLSKSATPPTYPYKSCHFLNKLIGCDLPRNAITSVLRFWMTPIRPRVCCCKLPTCNLVNHLLFECSKTDSLMDCYRAKLPSRLRLTLTPLTLDIFFSLIACSSEQLATFNRVVGKFEYPQT